MEAVIPYNIEVDRILWPHLFPESKVSPPKWNNLLCYILIASFQCERVVLKQLISYVGPFSNSIYSEVCNVGYLYEKRVGLSLLIGILQSLSKYIIQCIPHFQTAVDSKLHGSDMQYINASWRTPLRSRFNCGAECDLRLSVLIAQWLCMLSIS